MVRGVHHSYKLQNIYNTLKVLPELSILEDIESISELNTKEVYWINKLNATILGLNISPGGDGPGHGELNHQSLYSLDDYTAIVTFLAETDMSPKEVAQELDISHSVVSHISTGESHQYLKNIVPELYTKMLNKVGTRVAGSHNIKHKKYPILKKPNGELIVVKASLKTFAINNNLDPSGMYKLINGKLNTYKNWKVFKL
jgi:predicted XRE-type DNA-binding protein